MFPPPVIDIECAQSVCSTPEPSPGCATGETIKSFFSDPPSPRQHHQQQPSRQQRQTQTLQQQTEQTDSVFLRYLYEQKQPQADLAAPNRDIWATPAAAKNIAVQPGATQSQPMGGKMFKPATLSDRFGVLEDGLTHPSRSPVWNPGEGMQIAGFQLPPVQTPVAYALSWQAQQQSTPGISALLHMLVQNEAENQYQAGTQAFVHAEHLQAPVPAGSAQRPSPLDLALAMARLTDVPKQKKREKGIAPVVHTEEDLAAHEAMGEAILASFTRLAALDQQELAPPAAGTPFSLYQQFRPQRNGPEAASSRPVCLDHLKGTCHKARKTCKFAHPPLNNGLPYAGDIGIPRVCEVWACTGFCKFGNRCKYEHPPLMGELQYTPAVTKKMLEFALARGGPGEVEPSYY